MHTRENALNKWLKGIFKDKKFDLKPLNGDASFRRYFRLHINSSTQMVMDAPPEKEPLQPFIHINQLLTDLGVRTPRIYARDETQGFLLIEDFGDQLLLNALSASQADTLYKSAIDSLLCLQTYPIQSSPLPIFNTDFMLQELGYFQEWFLNRYLALVLTPAEEQLLKQSFNWLTTTIAKQPLVLIHRDFHSRNLMVLNQTSNLGIIDFQDAMVGPLSYDLVSLLKDCYVEWPEDQILHWANYFYTHLPADHKQAFPSFIEGFTLCGLQRHIKVLGVFCRLHLRDHKSGYLNDLPLTFRYVMRALENCHQLSDFYQFMQERVRPCFIQKSLI